MVYATVVLFAVGAVIAPGSISKVSVQAMLPFFGILALVAAGQTMVVMTRGLDLSLPGMMSLAGLGASKFASDNGNSLILALLVTVIGAIVAGAANGAIVAYLSVTPLIATLATGAVLAGVAFAYSGGIPARAPEGLTTLSTSTTLGVSNTCLIALVVVCLLAFLASRSVWGRKLAAIGSSESAARLSGLRVERLQVSAYVAAALCAALAGLLLAGYVGTPDSSLGADYLLPAIASVVLGGTLLGGGRGRVVGSVVAALFFSQLTAVVLALGVPTATQFIIEALILALAVAAQSLKQGELSIRRLVSKLVNGRRVSPS